MSDSYKNFIPTIDREWNENIEGECDENDFFYTPNGSKQIN